MIFLLFLRLQYFLEILNKRKQSKKNDATNYFGFSSPNFQPLGEVGAEIKISRNISPVPKKPFFHRTLF